MEVMKPYNAQQPGRASVCKLAVFFENFLRLCHTISLRISSLMYMKDADL